jgi:hypothetical protein
MLAIELHFSALRARSVRHPRGSAILTDDELLLLHGKVRTPLARLASGVMFGWYACHMK